MKFNQFMFDYLPQQQLAQSELKYRQMEVLYSLYESIVNEKCELIEKYSLLSDFLQYLGSKKVSK